MVLARVFLVLMVMTLCVQAGGCAGMCVDLTLFPLDTIKTRLQSQQGFYKAGGFRGIYAGVPSAAVGSFPNGETRVLAAGCNEEGSLLLNNWGREGRTKSLLCLESFKVCCLYLPVGQFLCFAVIPSLISETDHQRTRVTETPYAVFTYVCEGSSTFQPSRWGCLHSLHTSSWMLWTGPRLVVHKRFGSFSLAEVEVKAVFNFMDHYRSPENFQHLIICRAL